MRNFLKKKAIVLGALVILLASCVDDHPKQLLNSEVNTKSLKAIGYWSSTNCRYGANMTYFSRDGFVEVRLKGEKLFPNLSGDKYAILNNVITIGNNEWVFLDSDTLQNHYSIVFKRCNIDESKEAYLTLLNSFSPSSKNIKLCSGHDTSHRCSFDIKKIGQKFHAMFIEVSFPPITVPCKLTFSIKDWEFCNGSEALFRRRYFEAAT